MTEYKYLGKTVKDTGEKGLDNPSEFRGIIKSIISDYKEGKIPKETAKGRLLLLYRLTFPEYNHKVSKISEKTLENVRKEIKEAMKELGGDGKMACKTKRTVKKLSKKQMISYLKKWLRGRGIDPDTIDLEAIVDESLSYEENKQIVLEHIKPLLEIKEEELKREEDKSLSELKEHLFKEAMKIHEQRDWEEREEDERIKAKHVIDLMEAKSEKQAYNWFLTWLDNLHKMDAYDIEGVDYIPELSEDNGKENKENINWTEVLKMDSGIRTKNKAKSKKENKEKIDKPKAKTKKLLEYTMEFLEARNRLIKYLKEHEVDNEQLKEVWAEILKMQGKDINRAKRADKAKKAKRSLRKSVHNILKWITNPYQYDLLGVDE